MSDDEFDPPRSIELTQIGATMSVALRDRCCDASASTPSGDGWRSRNDWSQHNNHGGPAEANNNKTLQSPLLSPGRSRDPEDVAAQRGRRHSNQGYRWTTAAMRTEDFPFLSTKYHPIQRNHRYRLYMSAGLLAIFVGWVLGTVLVEVQRTLAPPPLPERATIGIRENIERYIGSSDLLLLDDPMNPYSKALHWIQNVDPLQLPPTSPQFFQRYLTAYLYYATSIDQPWTGGCQPLLEDDDDENNTNTTQQQQSTPSDYCTYRLRFSDDSKEFSKVPAFRWLRSTNECKWAGLTCDEFHQLRSIDLNWVNMTGTFPVGITRYPFLQSISMPYKQLRGRLPSVLGHMKHLLHIMLEDNQLSGSIPDHWYASRNLQGINVAMNRITGTISPNIKLLSDLTKMSVYKNMMTGTVPSILGDLHGIYSLRLDHNQFTGPIPTELGKLRKCEEISLGTNRLIGEIPTEIAMCTGLQTLTLGENHLNGTIPSELFTLFYLKKLELFDNAFTGSLSTLVGNLHGLEKLQIENNNFAGTLPTQLGVWTALTVFTASGNSFTGQVPDKLCCHTKQDRLHPCVPLKKLQVDCAESPPSDVVVAAKVTCPAKCCTHCCYDDGATSTCYPVA